MEESSQIIQSINIFFVSQEIDSIFVEICENNDHSIAQFEIPNYQKKQALINKTMGDFYILITNEKCKIQNHFYLKMDDMMIASFNHQYKINKTFTNYSLNVEIIFKDHQSQTQKNLFDRVMVEQSQKYIENIAFKHLKTIENKILKKMEIEWLKTYKCDKKEKIKSKKKTYFDPTASKKSKQNFLTQSNCRQDSSYSKTSLSNNKNTNIAPTLMNNQFRKTNRTDDSFEVQPQFSPQLRTVKKNKTCFEKNQIVFEDQEVKETGRRPSKESDGTDLYLSNQIDQNKMHKMEKLCHSTAISRVSRKQFNIRECKNFCKYLQRQTLKQLEVQNKIIKLLKPKERNLIKQSKSKCPEVISSNFKSMKFKENPYESRNSSFYQNLKINKLT